MGIDMHTLKPDGGYENIESVNKFTLPEFQYFIARKHNFAEIIF